MTSETLDLSGTGAGLRLDPGSTLPTDLEVAFDSPEPVVVRARLVWRERVGRTERAGVAFRDVSTEARRALVRIAFSADGALSGAHDGRTRSELLMAGHLLAGLVRAFLPLRARRRLAPRRRALRAFSLVTPGGRLRALRLDVSEGGLGLVVVGAHPPAEGEPLAVLSREGVRCGRVAHARRVVPGVWRLGLAYAPAPLPAAEVHVYLAA
jgi:cellulose synthase (UDP-forming)